MFTSKSLPNLLAPSPPTYHHYSTPDWDKSSANWILDLVNFVSLPSSIKGTNPSACMLLCRVPTTLCLPQGMLVTWVTRLSTYTHMLYFRNQAPLGTSSQTNTYRIVIGTATSPLVRYIGASGTTLVTWPHGLPALTWRKYRVTWWNGFNLLNEDCCIIKFDYHDGADWIEVGTYYDKVQPWKDSEVNRVGIASSTGCCFDDTEIWGP